jgi:poly(hydroxyalkanoate) granule-associated protein
MNTPNVRRVADKTEEVRRDVTAAGREAGREIWLAGLGALGRVETEGRELFDRLVKRGRSVEAEQFQVLDKGVAKTAALLEDWSERVQDAVETSLENVLHTMNLPSRQDLNRLSSRLDTLSRKVEKL